jgi:uncharacterized membrane protein YphA (DoxX/SURF4 family)
MNTNSLLLWGLLLTLALSALSIFIRRSPTLVGPSPWTQFFLVALRLSIGWHFLVEGLDKLNSPTWSSEPYLREATGPLAPYFRDLAGDRVVQKMTVPKDGAFPAELAIEWQGYLDGVASFYELNAEQTKQATAIMEKTKADTLHWLKTNKKLVPMISEYPPPATKEMSIAERLAEYSLLEEKLHEIEQAQISQYGEGAFAKYKSAKANLNKRRSELKADLDKQTLEFKLALRDGVLAASAVSALPVDFQQKVLDAKLREEEARIPNEKDFLANNSKDKEAKDKLTGSKETAKKLRAELKESLEKKSVDPALRDDILGNKALAALPAEYQIKPSDAKEPSLSLQGIYHQLQLKKASSDAIDLPPQAAKVFEFAFDKKKDKEDPNEFLPSSGILRLPTRPITSWKMLDWSDFLVKWGITAVGVCLLLGFLTRTACVVGAGLLLMFFLAMPPLPDWPESPRAEGHYLFINKNIIEMLALLTLATTRSGRWAGIDGLLQFCCPGRWKKA